MFTKTETGFQISFENRYVVSVQFGRRNYCSNRVENSSEFLSSEDAEVAIIYNEELFVTRNIFNELFQEDIMDDVAGYVSSEKVAKIISYVSKKS